MNPEICSVYLGILASTSLSGHGLIQQSVTDQLVQVSVWPNHRDCKAGRTQRWLGVTKKIASPYLAAI